MLRDAGIELPDFPKGLRDEVAADNNAFVSQFRGSEGLGDQGVCFDYTQNDGRFTITDDDVELVLRVGECGSDSVYLLDYENHIGQPSGYCWPDRHDANLGSGSVDQGHDRGQHGSWGRRVARLLRLRDLTTAHHPKRLPPAAPRAEGAP